MGKLIVVGFIFCILGTSIAEAGEQRIDAGVTALQFNEVNSQYMPRPTFASIKTELKTPSKSAIQFEIDGYGRGVASFEIAPEFIDENIEAINKYLKWAAMAKEKGDMLDKKIADVRGLDIGPFYDWNSYQFHSGNKQAHYLVITKTRKGLFGNFEHVDGSGTIVLDEQNANNLIKILLEFKEGKISVTKSDDYK